MRFSMILICTSISISHAALAAQSGAAGEPPLPVIEAPGVAAPPAAAAVCTGVTCAGHGNCVDLKGTPTCACYEGYMPDSVNGLNCLAAFPVVAAANPLVTPAPEAPLSEQARVERALDGRFLGNEYELYRVQAAGQISFAQYMWEDTQRRRKRFSGGAMIGGMFIAAGLALYVTSFMTLEGEGDDHFVPMLMSAIGSAALGGILLGVGVHGARHEKRNRDRLDGLLFEERNDRPLARRWFIGPFATAGAAGAYAGVEL